jgi:hypothetical protein
MLVSLQKVRQRCSPDSSGRFSPLAREKSAANGSARLPTGGAEKDFLCDRVIQLFRSYQDSRPDHHRPGFVDRKRERHGARIVRQDSDEEAVDVAERPMYRFQLAAEILDMLLGRSSAPNTAFPGETTGAL